MSGFHRTGEFFQCGDQILDAYNGATLIAPGEGLFLNESSIFVGRDFVVKDGDVQLWINEVNLGLYGQELIDSSYDRISPELRAEVERERIRYWEVDPALLQ